MPKISVLMPVYNAEDYLSEAINSVMAQTFTDWELIIVNDGSTDRSEDIIKSYSDDRIKYFRNAVNKGLIYTRSLMIEKSSAQYLAFLDSDDVALPERLKKQADFLDQNPGYIFCGTWGIMIDGAGKKIGKINLPETNEEIKCGLVFSNTFMQSSIMIRKSVFETHSYNKDFPVVEDYELWCRLSEKYKLKNIPEPLICYRWHEGNTSLSRKDLMEAMLKKVYLGRFARLSLSPTDEELNLHAAIRDKNTQNTSNKEFFGLLKPWMKKLSETNKKLKIYDKNTFLATICFRWIFACKERGIYMKVPLFPVSLNFGAFCKLMKLLYDRAK